MSGWTQIGTAVGTSPIVYAFGKIAAGSDTGTVSLASSGTFAAVTYQIDAWSGAISDVGFAGANQASGAGNPPNLIMASSDDFLWFAVVSTTSALPTGAPTNYTALTNAGSAIFVATARRNLTAGSEDPGAFTGGSFFNNFGVATVAVAPVATGIDVASITGNRRGPNYRR